MKHKIILMFIILTLFSFSAQSTVILVKNTNFYIGLSTDTKPTSPGYAAVFYETNTGKEYIYNGSAWVIKYDGYTTSSDTLTAPGSKLLEVKGFKEATIFYSITDKNTSVTHVLQGKTANSAWTSLIGVDSLITTANKDSFYQYLYCASLDSIRFKFISEAGGTDAKIIINTKKGNNAR